MGLFDSVYGADPRTQGLLAAGAAMMSGASRTPIMLGERIGQGYLAGNEAYQQAIKLDMQRKQMEEQAKLRDLQVQEFKAKMDEAARARARDEQTRQLFGRFTTQPQPANPADPVMGVDATPAQPGGFDLPGYAMALGSVDPGQAINLLGSLQKEDKPQIVSPGQAIVKGGRVVYQAPDKPEKAPAKPSAIQEYEYAVSQGYKGTFAEWDATRKKNAAPSVNLNMGQKGYENESKLRNDFKSEPIYKDYQDMSLAHKQIKASLAAESPIGDTAAATKIMKLLDPGSVVRESELGIAMAASGRMDRLRNYVDLWTSGKKLTPQQRADFGALADELMRASGQAYNQKRGEYEQLGKRYLLDTAVLGIPYADVPTKPTPVATPTLEDVRAERARRAAGGK